MSVIVVRHGLSEANNRENYGTLAFASTDAPLMPAGIVMAQEVGQRLVDTYDIDRENTTVAVSELRRTQQTAQEAGFSSTTVNPLLNEVIHNLSISKIGHMIHRGELPYAAIEAAQALLETPPPETIWFTHGLVIAGLCHVLGVARGQRFIPKFCEARRLPVNNS